MQGTPYQGEATIYMEWSYDTTGNPGHFVKIELLKGGATNKVINSYASIGKNGNGLYNWPVPVALANGNDYKVRITSVTNPACTDTSDSAFAMYHQIKAVTSPSEGQVLQKITGPYNITWTLEGSYPNELTVDLMLFKKLPANNYMGYIAKNIPINARSYMWTVGKLQEAVDAQGLWVPGDGVTQYYVGVRIHGYDFGRFGGKFTIKTIPNKP